MSKSNYYLPKRNTYHNRGDFFRAKQTEEKSPEDFWRRLIEIEKMQLQHIFIRRTTDIQIYDGNHRFEKNAKQNDDRENIRTENDNQADQTEQIREEEQEKHNTGGTNFGKRKVL